MGADGHIIICRRADFEAANPDVPPSWLSLYTGEFLGVECCWGYWGDNLFEPNYVTPYGRDQFWATHVYENDDLRDATAEETERIMAAACWFQANAESHEVWT